MKSNKLAFLSIIVALLFSSCSITKRHYMSGYSIDWSNSNPAKESKPAIVVVHPSVQDFTLVNKDSATSQLPEKDFPLTASSGLKTFYKHAVNIGLKNKNAILSYTGYPISDCDIISLKNGSQVDGKVLEITSTEIKYKRCDNIDGPIIIINKSDVTKIRYVNGITELINAPSTAEDQDYYSPSPKSHKPANRANSNGKPYHKTLNTFAIASLIAAILALIVILPLALLYTPLLLILIPAPIVLGIMALKEINANPELYKGKGMAIFGIIFGGILTSIILLFLLLFLLLLALI